MIIESYRDEHEVHRPAKLEFQKVCCVSLKAAEILWLPLADHLVVWVHCESSKSPPPAGCSVLQLFSGRSWTEALVVGCQRR